MANNYTFTIQAATILKNALANTFSYIIQSSNTYWLSANTDAEANTGPDGNEIYSEWFQFGINAVAGALSSIATAASSSNSINTYYGSGAPTLSAAQGSLYLRSDGSNTTNRAYINTNGSTGWTGIVTET